MPPRSARPCVATLPEIAPGSAKARPRRSVGLGYRYSTRVVFTVAHRARSLSADDRGAARPTRREIHSHDALARNRSGRTASSTGARPPLTCPVRVCARPSRRVRRGRHCWHRRDRSDCAASPPAPRWARLPVCAPCRAMTLALNWPVPRLLEVDASHTTDTSTGRTLVDGRQRGRSYWSASSRHVRSRRRPQGPAKNLYRRCTAFNAARPVLQLERRP